MKFVESIDLYMGKDAQTTTLHFPRSKQHRFFLLLPLSDFKQPPRHVFLLRLFTSFTPLILIFAFPFLFHVCVLFSSTSVFRGLKYKKDKDHKENIYLDCVWCKMWKNCYWVHFLWQIYMLFAMMCTVKWSPSVLKSIDKTDTITMMGTE